MGKRKKRDSRLAVRTQIRARDKLQIHANIRTLREALGLTQEQLGTRAGCSRQQICQYETGRRTPPLHRLGALAAGLCTDVTSLYGSEE